MRCGRIKSPADIRKVLFVLVNLGFWIICSQLDSLIARILDTAVTLLCIWELYDLFRMLRRAKRISSSQEV